MTPSKNIALVSCARRTELRKQIYFKDIYRTIQIRRAKTVQGIVGDWQTSPFPVFTLPCLHFLHTAARPSPCANIAFPSRTLQRSTRRGAHPTRKRLKDKIVSTKTGDETIIQNIPTMRRRHLPRRSTLAALKPHCCVHRQQCTTSSHPCDDVLQVDVNDVRVDE